jgi:periplasmic copper chaperone A
VSSDGTADRLIDARTDAASTVEFHESVLASDGTASMRRLAAMVLPSGGSLVLEPGGLHLMLLDVDRLEIGETVEVTLVWEHAGEMVIVATVVDPAEALEGHQES